MTPAIANLVHYVRVVEEDAPYTTIPVEEVSQPVPAIITQVTGGEDDEVNLYIIDPLVGTFQKKVKYSVTPAAGFWSWPPPEVV